MDQQTVTDIEFDDAPEAEIDEPTETAEQERARVAAELEQWKRATVPGAARLDPRQVRSQLRETFEIALAPYGNSAIVPGQTSPEPTGADRLRASVEALADAIERLGKRDRAGARAWLVERRAKLEGKLALFTGLGRWLDGPAAEALIDRYVSSRNAAAVARVAFQNATRENVAAARAELDICEADEREIDREIVSIKEHLWYPRKTMIDPALVEQAREHTQYLIDRSKAPGDEHRAVSFHAALDQGRDASPEEARLWIAFEPAKGGELFDLRWARFTAAHADAAVH